MHPAVRRRRVGDVGHEPEDARQHDDLGRRQGHHDRNGVQVGAELNKCPAGTSLIVSTAVVTGGSGAALKVITKGQKGTASVCVTKTSSATLEPGTKYVF